MVCGWLNRWDLRQANLLSATLLLVACGSAQGSGSSERNENTSGGGRSGSGHKASRGARQDEPGIAFPQGGAASGGQSATGGNETQDGVDKEVTPECAKTEVTAVDKTTTVPADILISVDTSGSMTDEVQFVQDELNAFSTQITDSGVDARVILIASPDPSDDPRDFLGICIDAPLSSGSCPDDSSPHNYVHLPQRVNTLTTLSTLTRTYPDWGQYLRADSTKVRPGHHGRRCLASRSS